MNSQVPLALFYCFCFSFFGVKAGLEDGLTEKTEDENTAQANTRAKTETETNTDGVPVKFSLRLPGVSFYIGYCEAEGVSFIESVVDKDGKATGMPLKIAQQLYAGLKERKKDVFEANTRKVLDRVEEIVGNRFKIEYHDYDASIDLETTLST